MRIEISAFLLAIQFFYLFYLRLQGMSVKGITLKGQGSHDNASQARVGKAAFQLDSFLTGNPEAIGDHFLIQLAIGWEQKAFRSGNSLARDLFPVVPS